MSLDLHRANENAGWLDVPADERTFWQRLAYVSRGVVTPGNLLSVFGGLLVVLGLYMMLSGELWQGAVVLLVGRLADILDGFVASKTGTLSRLGEALDAIIDKLALAAALLVFLVESLVPVWFLVLVALQNILSAIINLYAHLHKRTAHPSLEGKLSTALAWAGLLVFVLAEALRNFDNNISAQLFLGIGYVLALGFAIIGSLAIINYLRVVRSEKTLPAGAHTFQRILVVFNPASTNVARSRRRIYELQQLLPQTPLEIIETAKTNAANHDLLYTHRRKLGPDTLLCIAAGDGTVNRVIETLLLDTRLNERMRQTVLLPLWGGNANDLAYMLNGLSSHTLLRKLFIRGQRARIYPLAFRVISPSGHTATHIAACYASFGASAYAANAINTKSYRQHWAHRLKLTHSILEIYTVIASMIRSPRVTITERDVTERVYERAFINGSRIAKMERIPIKLNQKAFYHATVRHKQLEELFYILRLLRHRRFGYISNQPIEVILKERCWAQFDGEVEAIPAGSTVHVSIAKQPFVALSTKL